MVFFVGLQDTTTALDFRVTILEENGGGGGNSSVAELEVRVEELEGTAADHEIRLTAAEENIQGMKLMITNLNIIELCFNNICFDYQVCR